MSFVQSICNVCGVFAVNLQYLQYVKSDISEKNFISEIPTPRGF